MRTTRIIGFSASDEFFQEVQDFASKHDLTLSQTLRHAFREFKGRVDNVK